MLEQRQTLEDNIYLRGHGLLALFLLCFCSVKKAFYVMKEIYFFYYADILHPDQIKKEDNYHSIINHIISVYSENFSKKKDTSPEVIEKIKVFIRKYLFFQYNFFFLNQLNLSCAYQALEQLFLQRQHEVMTRTMVSIINLNIKLISEEDIEKINMKDIIYNKVQPETFQPLLLQQWAPVSKEDEQKILSDYNKQCQMEQYKLYDCGSAQLDNAVQECMDKENDKYKLMESHFLQEIKDLKNALKLAMSELEQNSKKIHILEIEKNNMIIKHQALKKKYDMTEIEYDDIQQKIQFLNERANKRQMHYNKEYESQISILQNQFKNQQQDYKDLEMLYNSQSESFKEQLGQKDDIIKRLKASMQIIYKSRDDNNVNNNEKEQLQEVYEFCQNKDTLQFDSDKEIEQIEISPKMFYSYYQPQTKQFASHILKIQKSNTSLKQEDSSTTDDTSNSQSEERQKSEDENQQEIEDEQAFYAYSGQLTQNSVSNLSDNDQSSQNIRQKHKSCTLSDKNNKSQPQSANSTQTSLTKLDCYQEQDSNKSNIDVKSQNIDTQNQNSDDNNNIIQNKDIDNNKIQQTDEKEIKKPEELIIQQNNKLNNQQIQKLLQNVQFKSSGQNLFSTQQLMKQAATSSSDTQQAASNIIFNNLQNKQNQQRKTISIIPLNSCGVYDKQFIQNLNNSNTFIIFKDTSAN